MSNYLTVDGETVDALDIEHVHLSMAGEMGTNGEAEAGAKTRCTWCKGALVDEEEPPHKFGEEDEPWCTERMCSACEGTGLNDESHAGTVCDTCDGHGFLPHQREPMPLSWCNSAGIHLDEEQDQVTVTISVGDPRGAFAFTVGRFRSDHYLCQACNGEGAVKENVVCPECRGTCRVSVDELRVWTPAPGEPLPHMQLESLGHRLGAYRIKR